ncbi:MAG: DUF1761 domain-containing protein [bacterium]|nr:DUF1761 domain-containing protein [bacterium]
MTLSLDSISISGIIIAHLFFFITGGIWYSPGVFGSIWAKSLGFDIKSISMKDGLRSMMLSNIPGILNITMIAVILELTKARTILDSLLIAAVLFVIVAAFVINNSLYENRKPVYLAVTLGYQLTGFMGAAVILSIF